MEKRIKKYGNSVIIMLNKEDREINDIDVGDHIEFTITKVIKKDKK